MIREKVRKSGIKKRAFSPVLEKKSRLHPRTKFVELITDKLLADVQNPFGPGYPVLFDNTVDVTGWREIRVWVHVFVENYETTPIVTSQCRLQMRFMHNFGGGNAFDYETATLTTDCTSYIDGYAAKPIIGNKVRLLCHPENLPPGPYRLSVTYLLV